MDTRNYTFSLFIDTFDNEAVGGSEYINKRIIGIN